MNVNRRSVLQGASGLAGLASLPRVAFGQSRAETLRYVTGNNVNTLDPTVLACYPEFNKKPVQVFFKPGLDEEKDSSGDYQIESKNEEERYMRRVFGAYYDSSRRAYAARFNYNGTTEPA